MEKDKKYIRRISFLLVLMLLCRGLTAWAQQGITVKGVVLDENEETVIGASVMVKGSTTMGTISDIDGNFQLMVPDKNTVLTVRSSVCVRKK